MDDNIKKSETSFISQTKDGYLVDEHAKLEGVPKDKEVQASLALYERYKRKRENWDTNAKRCERFRAGYQWTTQQIQELARQKKAPIVVNLQNPAVEQLKSMLTSNDPRFNGLPREGSDRDTAKAFGELFAYLWQQNRCNVKLKDTIDDYSVKGLGYMTAYWDPYKDFGKGEIVIEDLDPLNVFVDPLSKKRDFSDARHILVVNQWTAEQVMNVFKGINKSFFKDLATVPLEEHTDHSYPGEADLESSGDEHMNYYRIIDRYSKRRIERSHFSLDEFEMVVDGAQVEAYKSMKVFYTVSTDLSSGEQTTEYALEADDIANVHQAIKTLGVHYHIIMEMDPQTGQPDIVPVPGPPGPDAIAEVRIEQTTIGDLIASGVMSQTDYIANDVWRVLSIGEKVYYKGYTGIADYQVVPFPNRHKRNPYPHSDVLSTMSLQKELNVTRMHIMTHTANTAGITVGMPRGSGKVSDVEDKLSKAGVRVIEYNHEDGGQIHFMHPPQLPNQLYESEKRFESTIYEQFGIYPFMGGGQQAHRTSSGILIMDELAQRRIASKRSDIEESLNVLGKVVVQLIQKHYTEKKVVRILQPSGRYNEIEINSPVYDQFSPRLLHRINDVTIGAYDLIIVSGSTLPSNRMIRMEYFLKLYMQNLIDQYEVLKNVDEVDAEGVMERMGVLQQLQAQVMAMQEEIAQLQGDLQTADREAVGARKRVEVEKFKTKLAQMQASIETALNAGKERALANMRTQKTAAGQQQDSALDDGILQTIDNLL